MGSLCQCGFVKITWQGLGDLIVEVLKGPVCREVDVEFVRKQFVDGNVWLGFV